MIATPAEDKAVRHVATLVAAEGPAALDTALIANARDALGASSAVDWLAPGQAVDLLFEAPAGSECRAVASRLKEALGSAPVDVIVQPRADRRKALLLADMDSTMIGQECIDELADFAGLKAEVSAITEQAMRGEIAFEPALRARVEVLAGLKVEIVDEIVRERITLTPGARTLIGTMRARGGYCCLVSGGFTLFTQKISTMIGFDEHRANRLLVEGGLFTGSVTEPILGRDAKRATLIELREERGLSPAAVLAVGDGANDLAMLEEAGLGVAFRAKAAVAAAADAAISHADLSALLYAQGYRRAEFVEG